MHPKIVVLEDRLTPEEHLNLGVAYEHNREFDAAKKEYALAAKELPLAYLYLGNVYFQENDWNQAELYYKKALRADDHNADACNNLAWLYCVRGKNLDEAEQLVRKAIELNPSKKQIYADTLDKIQNLRNK